MLFLSDSLPACFPDLLIIPYCTPGVHELSYLMLQRKVNVLQVFCFTVPKVPLCSFSPPCVAPGGIARPLFTSHIQNSLNFKTSNIFWIPRTSDSSYLRCIVLKGAVSPPYNDSTPPPICPTHICTPCIGFHIGNLMHFCFASPPWNAVRVPQAS